MFGLNLKLYGLIFLAVLASIVGLYGYGKQAGRSAAQLKQKNRAMKVIKDAQQAEESVRALDDDDVEHQLRQRWSRD